jgi:iron complex outermembrane receptor protein
MVRMLARSLFSSFSLVFLVTLVAAQDTTTGHLIGTVTDPQGGVIPRAAVLARNSQTGSEFRAIANGVGVWIISSVPSGNYTVSVTAQGLKPASFKDVIVDGGATAVVDAMLQVSLAETVVVTASKVEQELVNAPATLTVISEQTIRELPTQNVADLLRAVPGINVTQTSARSFGVNGRAASSAMPSAQLALIDGRTIYQDYFGYVAWDLVPTSLDEVKQMEVMADSVGT